MNLSRGGPSKYASSNRIATLMGNGILTFMSKGLLSRFFQDDEIITYKNRRFTEQLSSIQIMKKD